MRRSATKIAGGSVCWALLLAHAPAARAEQLITRVFSTEDGLAHNTRLGDILQDSRGFIWITTQGGVSRFDGQQFQNFGIQDGLGYPLVNKICETRAGEIWVATNGAGAARYDPQGPPKRRFVTYATGSTQNSNAVNSVREGPDGFIWAAADAGVFRLDPGGRSFQPVAAFPQEAPYSDVLEDSGKRVWALSGSQGLFRRNADGSVDHWGLDRGIPSHSGAMYLDRSNGLWAATPVGALQFDPNASSRQKPVLRTLRARQGTPGLYRLLEDRRGEYWVTGIGGLFHFDGQVFIPLGAKEGIPGRRTWGLTEDRDGNLWVGVEGVGVMRIVRRRFSAWSVEDGLAHTTVMEVFPLARSAVGVASVSDAGLRVQQFENGAFKDLMPFLPLKRDPEQRPVLMDHLGDLWVSTAQGIARFRDGRLIQHFPVPADNAYETRSGDIWFCDWGTRHVLARWNRAANRMDDLSPSLAAESIDPWTMIEDGGGNLWFAGVNAGLYRYRDGRFTRIPSPFPPAGRFKPYTLHIDDTGRLWTGYTRGALAVVDRPAEAAPKLKAVAWGGGAVNSPILSLTSDREGRLYVGSATGLWLFDAPSGRTQSFAATVPMLGGPIYSSARDGDGNLWFGTDRGLVRVQPSAALFRDPPAVRLTEVRLTDGEYPLSGWGESAVRTETFPVWQNRFEFSFSGLGEFGPWRYRYRLEPRDRDWTTTPERTVIYQQLPPGAYRFSVQAVDPAGVAGMHAAVFGFEIAPHLWQRWWFLALCAFLISSAFYAFYRWRLHQLLQVERVRMRIATDLHDDIGSALSQIGLLSEVARRQANGTASQALERIAGVSRETAASMSDIVWTINPQRDSLGDLGVRIRRFATEMCTARDIDCTVLTPESDADWKLGIDTRRQLLLVAKEAIHNVIRHAHATRVSIALMRQRGLVVFRIEDDGAGFDPSAAAAGHGIASMRSRTEKLGGRISIESGEGGTRLEARIPV